MDLLSHVYSHQVIYQATAARLTHHPEGTAMLTIRRTALIHTSCGVIKVTPQAGRKVNLRLPRHIKVTDQAGNALTGKARKR